MKKINNLPLKITIEFIGFFSLGRWQTDISRVVYSITKKKCENTYTIAQTFWTYKYTQM